MNLSDILRGALAAQTTGLVGGPVDILNMALGGMGLPASEKPVMGSKWLEDRLGVQKSGSTEETLSELISSFATPGGAAKGAAMVPMLLATKGGSWSADALKAAKELKKYNESAHTVPAGPRSIVLADGAPVPAVHGQRAVSGVYDDPKKLLEDARVEPESPLLGELFGVTRKQLDEQALRMQDKSVKNPLARAPRSAPEHVEMITNPKNTKRVRGVIQAGLESDKMTGMPGWYVTQALKDRAEKVLGPELAEKFYKQHHAFASPMSAMGSVDTEIAKGTLAHLLFGQGRAGEFFDRSKMPKWLQTTAYPTGYSAAMRNLIESGGERFWKDASSGLAKDAASPKTPNYYFSKTGENWYYPTADAHFVRGVGLPDVRPMKTVKGERVMNMDSIGDTEMVPIGDWFANDVLKGTGLTGNVGQPILWGMLANRTGVKTGIGAPYLELMARNTAGTAKRTGKSADAALDDYILGSMGLKEVDPLQAYLGAFGSAR